MSVATMRRYNFPPRSETNDSGSSEYLLAMTSARHTYRMTKGAASIGSTYRRTSGDKLVARSTRQMAISFISAMLTKGTKSGTTRKKRQEGPGKTKKGSFCRVPAAHRASSRV